MGRFFLSGQTTCALLLGAGLLLRAQAALRSQDDAVAQQTAARTRPAELLGDHALIPRARSGQAPRVVRTATGQDATGTRNGKARAQARKPMAQRPRPNVARRCGASLAQSRPGFRCG